MKKIFVLLIMFFVSISIVDARSKTDCDYTLLSNLKEIANNVNISYQYNIVDNNAYFDVTISNLNPNIYFIDSSNNQRYNYTQNEITIYGYQNIDKINYTFFSANQDCIDSNLTVKYVSFPYYNPYYQDVLCEGISHSLCKRFNDTKQVNSYEEFVLKITEYKNSLKSNNDDNFEQALEYEKTLFDKIASFLVDYYYIILILIIVICIPIIYIGNKRQQFDLK